MWDGNTWNSTNGGPIAARFEMGGDPLEDRTGNDFWPPWVELVDGSCRAFVTLREGDASLVLNTKSSLVLTFTNQDAGEKVYTLANMKLVSQEPSQGRAVPGSSDLTFVYEAYSGATVPAS